jgi:hypothetical protein
MGLLLLDDLRDFKGRDSRICRLNLLQLRVRVRGIGAGTLKSFSKMKRAVTIGLGLTK